MSVAVHRPMIRNIVDFCRPSLADVREHIKPNLLLFLPVIAVSLYTVLDKFMLGAISGMTEAGYFESALKICTMPMTFIEALGVVMLPRMANLLAKGEREEAGKYLGGAMWLSMMLAFAFAFGIAGTAPVFAPVFFGEEFESCSLLMCVIAIDLPFVAWANVLRKQYLIPVARDRAYASSIAAGAVVNIVINVILMPSLGSLGASIAVAAAEVAVCVVQVAAVRGELPQLRWLRESMPYLAIGAAMFAAVRAVGTVMGTTAASLVVEVLVGVIVYAGLTGLWCKATHNRYYELFVLPALKRLLGSVRSNA